MKSLPTLLFVAALSAFVLIPVSFEVAVSLFFAAGLAGIVICDYGCEIRRRRVAVTRPRIERFGLAA